MAIAIDATAEGFNAASTSLTYSHTTSGSDRCLLVSIFKFGGADSVTGVTYNGVSMTQLGKVSSDASGYTYQYGLANPASGANNIVCSSSSSVQWFATSASYTGVDQTTPFPQTAVTQSTSNTTFSLGVTTTVDQSWLFGSGRSPSKVPTASSGTLVRKTNTTSGDAAWTLDSNGGRSVGSQTLDYTYAVSSFSYWIVVAIAPVAATPTVRSSSMLMMGIG